MKLMSTADNRHGVDIDTVAYSALSRKRSADAAFQTQKDGGRHIPRQKAGCDIMQTGTTIFITNSQTRDKAKQPVSPAKTEPRDEKSWQTKNLVLTFQNGCLHSRRAWFSPAGMQSSQSCDATLTILHAHFDYFASRFCLFCTAFSRFFRLEKGIFTGWENTSRCIAGY